MTAPSLYTRENAERWPTIVGAHEQTKKLRKQLAAALADKVRDDNVAVVVTGSVGRGEVTDGSDVDWFLLIDGPSDPYHAKLVEAATKAVAEVVEKEVGSTGTFAAMVSSHDLVHHIAGTQDSNVNLTRRVLLLAESHALVNPLVRKRVLRNLLSRYIGLAATVPTPTPVRVPHFLVNDIVRYWRTMATDYASKVWERNNKGWAIRNLKLRFSRKMLFVWGLLASFSGVLFPEQRREGDEQGETGRLLADIILQQTTVTPLDLLFRVASHASVADVTRNDLFDNYEAFLKTLSDSEKRKKLEYLTLDEANDDVFDGLRKKSRTFRSAVTTLFFDEHPDLKTLIKEYGVF